MDYETDRIPVKIDDDTTILIEIKQMGREDVGLDPFEFSSISESIEKLATALSKPIQNVKPNKATLKFGIEIAIEQGSLVSSIVRGNGKSNIEITLEWSK